MFLARKSPFEKGAAQNPKSPYFKPFEFFDQTHQAGYVGVVADRAGSNIIKVVGGATGTGMGLAGLGDTSPEGLLSTGLTVAGFIPGLQQAAAVGSIGVDIYKLVKAIRGCH